MIVVDIPGIGEVEVESEKALAQLKRQLDAHFAPVRETVAKREKVPEETLEALKQMHASTEKMMNSLVSEVKKIKPVVTVNPTPVTVSPPVVKVDAPIVNVPEQKPVKVEFPKQTVKPTPPVKTVKVINIERDWRGAITNCEFEVKR